MRQANSHRTKLFLFFASCTVVLPSCGEEQAASVTTKSSQSPTATYSVKTLGRYTFEPGALLFSADLKYADLVGVDLTDAVLSRSNLTGANLTGANLKHADLKDANLTDANLTDANLTGAQLNRSNLTGANLTGANLLNANLTGANLTGAIFDGAIGTTTTTAGYFPTWVTKVPEDVYIAPFAQSVCDILRTWRPPAETTSADVALLKKAESRLWDMILSGKSTTYSIISSSAAATLEYERKYPTDKVFPFSHAMAEINCDNLGFTPFNSKYGIDPETGNTKNNP